ncbi:MAG: hypothetical protein ACK42D_01110 [Candidatus Paceibacteria bacterium]
MKNKKKAILLVGSLFTALLILIRLLPINVYEVQYLEYVEFTFNILLFTPIILLLSLITYKMSESVFVAWWAFAKYAIPIILVLSFIVNAGFHHNPAGQWQDMFDVPVLFALYGIFAVGSVVQIVRGYFGSESR